MPSVLPRHTTGRQGFPAVDLLFPLPAHKAGMATTSRVHLGWFRGALLAIHSLLVHSALNADVLPDFSKRGALALKGIDQWAVPNVIIAGVAKGGSTDIWNVIEVYHSDFLALGVAGGKPLELEKEFNIPFISGDYLSHQELYPCPAEVLTSLMRCPRSVMTNDRAHEHDNGGRNLTKCHLWLDGAMPLYKSRIAPKYTMDAYPYLMRNSHEEMNHILLLNANNSNCRHSTTGPRSPLFISLTRDPYNRVVSYYNYFLLRSDAVPLEFMLAEEIDAYETSPKLNPLLRALEADNYTYFAEHSASPTSTTGMRRVNGVFPVTIHEAHFFIHAWEMLRSEAKKALAFQKKQNPKKNYEAEGVLLDNIYLPQVLGLLFPLRLEDKSAKSAANMPYTGARRFELPYPLLVLQSELLFSHMHDVFEQVLVPFFHTDAKTRAAVLKRERSAGVDESIIYTNSRSGKYDDRCSLSATMQCRLYKFYYKINANFVRVLWRLQQTGRIVVAPRIRSAEDVWWPRNLDGCT